MKQFIRPGFLNHSNIYEVNLRQYSTEGSFHEFQKHLPRLADMGVEILWFMPIHPIGVINRKGTSGSYYSISDHKGINPEFGTKDHFSQLVNAAHDLGIKVIIDWVANHCAWDHVWTRTNPEYIVRDANGGFVSPYDWTDVVQIDHNNQQQQAAMTEAMKYWVTEFRIDGFRADLAHLTPLPFWINAREVLDRIKPDLIWLAETEEPSYHDAFDISYTWEWMHTTENFVKNNLHIEVLRSQLHESVVKFGNELRMYYTSNHDENSWNGTEYEKFSVYAKAFAVFNHTFQNAVPLIYTGQEIPCMKRLAFFEKDPVNWNDVKLHSFYKSLNRLRKRNLLITNNTTVQFADCPARILGYYYKGDDAIIVLLSFETNEISIKITSDFTPGNYRDLFSGKHFHVSSTIDIHLHPGEYYVLEKTA